MLLNFTVPGAMRRAAHVITDSESSRDDILRVYRMDAHRVTAIHLAANEEFVPLTKLRASQLETEKYGICDPFVLSVGVLQPRKNLGLLVRAFAAIKSQTSLPHKLVLTGKAGWGTENLDGLLNQLGISEHVILTGYVPDEDLPMLYSAASVLAYPSMYEGFGLPPVESMSCGTPVLVSDAPCMPEIAGEGGWVLPARDPKPWTQAMIDLLSSDDLQSKWSGRGLKRAKDFSWETTAKKTMDVYRNILK